MKVTYIGEVEKVGFDGHEFPKGEAVEYTGSRADVLRNNRFFECETASTTSAKAPQKKRSPKAGKAG